MPGLPPSGSPTVAALWLLPRFTPWFFARAGSRVSEPQIKFVMLILFALGGLAGTAKSEAVLPAYLIGMVLAPIFLKDKELTHRVRVIAFTMLTPFYFLKAGSLVRSDVIVASAGLILVYLAIKMATKFVGILPLTRIFRFERREGMYTTLMMFNRPHLRLDLGTLRPHQPHHRRAPVHHPPDRRDRQRRGADPDRAALVPARVQGDRGGGTGQARAARGRGRSAPCIAESSLPTTARAGP